MRALIQRVAHAHVTINDEICGSIEKGLTVFLGVRESDSDSDAENLAQRISALRIFNDADEKMNLSVMEVHGKALVISQFTLHADTRKGNRPSYIHAAKPEEAERLYNVCLKSLRIIMGEENVASGVFRAMMKIHLVNDGPVTIMLKSKSEYER